MLDRIYLYVFVSQRGAWRYVGITKNLQGRERRFRRESRFRGLQGALRVLCVTDLATAKLYERRLIEHSPCHRSSHPQQARYWWRVFWSRGLAQGRAPPTP